MTQEDLIQTILKDSNFHLSMFTDDEINALRGKISIKETRGKQTPFVNRIIRENEIQLKPSTCWKAPNVRWKSPLNKMNRLQWNGWKTNSNQNA